MVTPFQRRRHIFHNPIGMELHLVLEAQPVKVPVVLGPGQWAVRKQISHFPHSRLESDVYGIRVVPRGGGPVACELQPISRWYEDEVEDIQTIPLHEAEKWRICCKFSADGSVASI
jgi:hypothetical protein